jgi:hypothetical protein
LVILVWCTPDLTRKGKRGWCHLILYGIKTKILPIRPIVTIEDMLLVFAWFARSLTLWVNSFLRAIISGSIISPSYQRWRKQHQIVCPAQADAAVAAATGNGCPEKAYPQLPVLRRVRCRCCRCGISVYLICETLIAIEWLEPGDPSSQLY